MNNSFRKNTHITSSHLLIHFIYFLLISLLNQFPVVSQGCHEEERMALLDFKSSLEDPSNRLFSWQQGIEYQNCCDWHGIQCSKESFHVISVNLRNTEYEIYLHQYSNNYYYINSSFSPPKTSLQGKLSPFFYNFTHLQYLDLAFNNFKESQIPLKFSTLTKLTHLDLSNSHFSGSISTQFTNLSSLKYLDLSCDLSFESDIRLQFLSTKWLRGLVNIQVLRLGGNDLSSQNNLAQHISFLSNLEVLDLSDCRISGPFFQEFNNLSRLSSLDMSFNPELYSPFPLHLANLTFLSSLNLSDCNLHGSVPYMPQLKQLNVGINTDLHVDLTRMFEHKWHKLQLLDISMTNVTGLFQSLTSNAPLLESLDASSRSSSNQVSFPKSICKLSNLQELILNDNNYTGTIPNCITMLRYLNRFEIRNNAIGGNVSLSSFLSKLNLTSLDLSSNKLMVSTDQHLHLYPKLKLMKLGLKSCNLTGLFPAFICDSTNLASLDLSQNYLTGTIPSCIYKLKNLIGVDLSHNNLHGPLLLPSQNVFYYGLAHNKFNGEISMEIGKRLSTAYWIFLSNNELTGSVPFSIFSKDSGLHSLDLSNNKLSGIIPTSIRYCASLRCLNLGNNNLTGNVPKGVEQSKDLEFFLLNDNNLDGNPLDFIGKHNSLQVLNLGNNNFQGGISTLFGSLKNIEILSLRSNNFNGSIPLIDLHQLQILDLSGNKFTGLISMNISNLAMLVSRYKNSYLIRGEYGADVQLKMVSKGIMMQYEKLYGYTSGIDLSCNILEGEIPEEIGLLEGLSMLNLSHNRLSGNIPQSVGSMNGLESFDLSYNNLSGLIPPSLASMDFLSYLNLSNNNLSGRIPRGPHIDTLGGDGSAYVNNSFLCGYLTKKPCEGDQSGNSGNTDTPDEDGEDDTKDKWYFYGVVSLGFIVGFWGLFFGLLLKKEKWWFGYWRAVDTVAVKIVQLFLRD